MSVSQLARSIKASPTLKLNETAAKLREKGEPVIHLGGGEPKSKAPLDAILNCATQLNTGEVRYAPADGLPALKKAILRYTEENYGRLMAPANVIVSSGAKQSIMNILYAILEPKDEVVFPAPYWVSYPEMVKLAGGVAVPVVPEDGSFQPSVPDIADKVGSYTKAVILNSPNNPSGVMYPADFIAEIVEFCEKKNLWLIMDDLYNRLVFDGQKAPNPYEFAKETGEASRLVVVQGVSKMYAMTGFRIGWAVGNRELVEAMTNIQGHQTSGPVTVSQWAAVGALSGVQTSIESLRLTLENQRNVMLDRLADDPGRPRDEAERDLLLLPRLQRLHEGLAEARRAAPRARARRDRAGQGVRHGRPPAPELLRDDQGDHGRPRADQVGARPATRPTSCSSATASS